jgi:hypothetical protein
MTAPVFETASSATSTGNTVTVNKPDFVASGDLLIACLAGRDHTAGFTCSGWTAHDSTNSSWLSKVAGGSEPATYLFTATDATRAGIAVAVIRISGVDQTTPIAAAPAAATATDASPNPPASGTVAWGDYLAVAMLGGQNDNNVNSVPANYTSRVEILLNETDDGVVCIATRALTGVTSEDPGTFGIDANDPWTAWTALVNQPLAVLHAVSPTDDITTTGWTTTPLWSKIDEDPASPDGTIITATAS